MVIIPEKKSSKQRNEIKPTGSSPKSLPPLDDILDPIVAFAELHPGAQTLALTARRNPYVPEGVYGIIDSYCTDVDCDCRVAYLSVVSMQMGQLAQLTFGWESESFYQDWMGDFDPLDDADASWNFHGLKLMDLAPQGSLAEPLLKMVGSMLSDKETVEFFKSRYFEFRAGLHQDA
ncbi:MAG: hypothetical protein M1415_04365 [Firmicutes bacterium]|nr:hypothetical protein [Bacillota bacterium]MCL5064594.1 hypothetical protein [Bacillota bacterium]